MQWRNKCIEVTNFRQLPIGKMLKVRGIQITIENVEKNVSSLGGH